MTIPNIKYVIDTGKVKRKIFDPFTGIDLFEVKEISKSEAWQRSGRSGRESSGKCFRLYTERMFEKLKDDIQPEILRFVFSVRGGVMDVQHVFMGECFFLKDEN